MKKVLSVFVLFLIILGVFSIPADAKTASEMKTMFLYLRGEGRGIEVTCSVPYDSKWKISDKKIEENGTEFVTSKGSCIIVKILNAYEDPDAKFLCKYLKKKKYKNKVLRYLCEGFKIEEKDAALYFRFKKDGNGKYLIVANTENEYGVIRALDEDHLFLCFMDTDGGAVSGSLKKKLITYTKQAVLEKKTAGIDKPDIEDDIPDVELDADKVVFSQIYSNMAWGYQKQALFIFGDGRIYTYDYVKDSGNLEGDLSDDNIIEYLKGTKASAVLDKDYLKKMYSYAIQIDPDAKYTIQHEMDDYGQKSLYFHDEKGNKVKFAYFGDVRYIYDDKYANELGKLWEDLYLHCM